MHSVSPCASSPAPISEEATVVATSGAQMETLARGQRKPLGSPTTLARSQHIDSVPAENRWQRDDLLITLPPIELAGSWRQTLGTAFATETAVALPHAQPRPCDAESRVTCEAPADRLKEFRVKL